MAHGSGGSGEVGRREVEDTTAAAKTAVPRSGKPSSFSPQASAASRAATYANLDLVKGLSVVDTNDAADHLGDNNHVTEVRLHHLGLLLWVGRALQR